MASLLVQGLVIYAASVFLWKLVRKFVVKSPLDCVPGPPTSSFIAGNIKELFDEHGWQYHYDILKEYGSVMKVKGLLGERLLFLFDPKALHYILVKDQYIYEEAPAFIATNKLMFGDGLLATLGEQHRKQRKMLNPVFSIAHMREMTPIFYEVTSRLYKAILEQVQTSPKEIDILHWMTRIALELIGQSGMGYSFDSLKTEDGSDELHPYSRSVKRFGVIGSGLLSGPKSFVLASYIFPITNQIKFPKLKRWIVDRLPLRWVQDLKEIVDVMHETAIDICKTKQKAIEEGHGDDGKKDIISILMRANAGAVEEDRLTDEEVFGQVASLTFAAMDTTSSALSRILSLLANHPEVQEKLRQELIMAKRENGREELGYDKLVTLPYLDAVCRETLRVYPPLTTAIRTVRKDMILPLSKPIKTTTGTETAELVIPNNTTILLSVLGANTNPEMWGEDAYEWKPERWLDPLPEKVGDAHMPGIYSHLMTFLGGSRACIGFKFSQLEMKVVLSILITAFRFEHSNKKIVWKMPGIAAPVVEGKDTTRPSLPMVISLIDK
ncbi:Cytochrome P450 3A6 [Leucoagaricus sp. SymC.cos]|nr:Cytochrome P450 3A6 [Leucoagaricus sp. SymC.cos]